MTQGQTQQIYERTMRMLGPALERVAIDSEFRDRLEANPLEALAEMHVELDAETRQQLEGKRFSEFWALRQRAAEGPVGLRDLPPDGALTDEQLEGVAGGAGRLALPARLPLERGIKQPAPTFAPPYVPVLPSSGDW